MQILNAKHITPPQASYISLASVTADHVRLQHELRSGAGT